jgi:hypothetical protein
MLQERDKPAGVINVILATTIVYEFIGPLAARFALQRAGEIPVKSDKHKK